VVENLVRQWVLYRLAFDHARYRTVVGVCMPAGSADGHSGAATVSRRFGSGLPTKAPRAPVTGHG